MRCEAVQRLIAACALDELAPPDRDEVLAHLAVCHRCLGSDAALRRVAGALRGMPELDASPERRARAVEAMRRGAAERLARPRWERGLRALFGRRRRVAVAALFAASLLGILSARLVDVRSPSAAAPVLVADAVQGPVTVERAPQSPADPLAAGATLVAGAVVRVGDGAGAVFRVPSGGVIECRAGTAFRWEPPAAAGADTVVTLYYGALWCDLAPLARGRYVIRDVRDRRLTVMGTKFEVVCR
jgi:anti-sigma factor RsiW